MYLFVTKMLRSLYYGHYGFVRSDSNINYHDYNDSPFLYDSRIRCMEKKRFLSDSEPTEFTCSNNYQQPAAVRKAESAPLISIPNEQKKKKKRKKSNKKQSVEKQTDTTKNSKPTKPVIKEKFVTREISIKALRNLSSSKKQEQKKEQEEKEKSTKKICRGYLKGKYEIAFKYFKKEEDKGKEKGGRLLRTQHRSLCGTGGRMSLNAPRRNGCFLLMALGIVSFFWFL